ncbi:hypothetical protein Cgig2_016435 [Carnegiea gigantea]|uniref:Uncharacterized protein n=1 Tax=Carnegiea gigantea TaxID=171969 RepID=A0A9Q1K4F6_9CARY|nr:hypothetical protein Cgig2_016435 [Carnegiea gigantea]
MDPDIWSYKGVAGAHIVFSDLCFLAAIWHWVYWDLEIFCDERIGKPSLNLPKIFGIHLFLFGLTCFGFGAFYVTGLYGPRIWVSDPYGLTGKVQPVSPEWGVEGFDPFFSRRNSLLSYCSEDIRHISSSPQRLYKELRMGNIEIILSVVSLLSFLQLLLLLERCGMVQQLLRSNYLVPLVINGIRDIFSKKYTKERAESKYSVEQVGVTVEFYDGELNGVSYSDLATMKKYARRAQLGENFKLDHATLKSDGLFYSSPRGWFIFGHASFAYSYSLETFGMGLEPYLEIFLLILTQIWMLKILEKS